jgi:lysophospholipase L1-like esterase
VEVQRARRVVALVAAAALVCVLAGVGWAWRLHEVAAPPRRVHHDAGTHVVVLGDSVATGAGCACTPFGPRLAGLLARDTSRHVDVVTLGQDGLTSAGLSDQLAHDGRTRRAVARATTVTVTIGANDFDPDRADDACGGGGTDCYADTLDGLSARIGGAVRIIKALAGADVQVLITGYWNVFLDGKVGATHGPTYQATSDALTRLVNAQIRTAAKDAGGTYVDLYAAFGGDDSRLLAPDGDHPSAAGHDVIARVLAAAAERH